MADDTGGKLSNAQNGMHPPLRKKKKKKVDTRQHKASRQLEQKRLCMFEFKLERSLFMKKKKSFIFPCSDDCLYLIPHFVSGDCNSILLTLERKKRKRTQKYDK